MSLQNIKIIVAVDNQGGFGKDGKIPWHFAEDFKRFKEITKDSICVMGRNTYEDMLQMVKSRKKGKAKKTKIKNILPNRKCYVVTSSKKEIEGGTKVPSIKHVIDLHPSEVIFILGGEQMYIEGLSLASKIYMTVISDNYECDRFFPVEMLEDSFEITNGDKYEIDDSILYFMEYSHIETN